MHLCRHLVPYPRRFGQISYLQIIPPRYKCDCLSTLSYTIVLCRIPSYTTSSTLGCGTCRQSRGRKVGDRIAGIKTFHANPSKHQRGTRIAKARVSPMLIKEACDTSATLNRVLVAGWSNHNARWRAPTSCTPAVTELARRSHVLGYISKGKKGKTLEANISLNPSTFPS